MFFKKKTAKPELLLKKNILLNCSEKPKDDVIREIGNLLYESGYVEKGYIDGMLEREKTFSTNIGNGIAIPHGTEKAKLSVKNSGIAVMVFPNGTIWNDERVKVVIAIAGVGEEHIDILANIAEKLSDPEQVEKVLTGSVDYIYNLFTGKG